MATPQSSSTLAALEQALEARRRRRRRIRRGLIAALIILLILLLWRCEEPVPPPGAGAAPQKVGEPGPGSAYVPRIDRPDFVSGSAQRHAWGLELHSALKAYAPALPRCLARPEAPPKGVSWIFRFEPASGQIKHLRFAEAETETGTGVEPGGTAVAPALERCLLEQLPEKVSLRGVYPAGWTEVHLLLRARLYR